MKAIDVESKKEQIAEIAKKYGLSFMALFGSQATGRVHAKSDVDIAVLGKQAVPFDTQTALWSALSDMLKRDDIEVIDLATASPTLMHVVVRDGSLLYEEEDGDFMKWKLYAIRVWMDTAWLRELTRKSLLEWAKRNA